MKAILIGLVLAACGKPQPSEAPRDVKAEAKAPTAQEAARKQARDVDLPKLRGTSRTVVTWADGKTQERIGGEITRLVDALTITDAQPSGGKIAATITFYRSSDVLAEVWVFESGEWGIKRAGETSWTLGVSESLAALIREN